MGSRGPVGDQDGTEEVYGFHRIPVKQRSSLRDLLPVGVKGPRVVSTSSTLNLRSDKEEREVR